MSRIAITGSTGMIGTALRLRLESAGHEVVGVVRGPQSDPSSTWDPAGGWFRPGALEGVDVVVHLAGASIGNGRWSDSRKAELRASRVAATRLLVDHLATLQKKPALVCASAVGFYGSRGDEELTEASGPGTGFLAELTRDWEAEAARARDLGVPVAILRFGVVIAREGGALAKMLLPFKLGVGGRIGSGKHWMAWVALDDAVGAAEHAIEQRLDGVFNVSSPNPVRNKELTRALGKVLKRPTIFPIPPFALRMMFGGSADELLLSSQRVTPPALLATGFAFRYPQIAGALERALKGGR